jgi:hypothetical protein
MKRRYSWLSFFLFAAMGVIFFSAPLCQIRQIKATTRPRKELNATNAPIDAERVALVIGNSQYTFHTPLRNPVNDARGIDEALTSLGFQVTHKDNLTKKAMESLIEEFKTRAENSQIVVFYYAGHAVQVNGNNYLVPVNARIIRSREVPGKAVDAMSLLRGNTTGRTRFNIIILDACRDNPLPRSLADDPSIPDRIQPGLASQSAPIGTLIAFATAPGKTASDGSGLHSPYTQSLLHYITQPGLPIQDVFRKVREDVYEETQHAQIPWENVSLIGNSLFYFKPPVEPEPLEYNIEEADDQVSILLNNVPIAFSNGSTGWQPVPKSALKKGVNSLEIQVYNQASFTGGIEALGGHKREGWRYAVSFRSPSLGGEKRYASGENEPPPERWGRTFSVISTTIVVDEMTGRISFR